MSALEQLEKEYDELGQQIAAMKAAKWPRVGDEYCWVTGEGGVCNSEWSGFFLHIERKAIGNIYRTESDALEALAAMKTVAKLRAQPGRVAFEFRADNWSVVCEPQMAQPTRWRGTEAGWQSIYFDSEEAVEAAIAAVGDCAIIAAANYFSQKAGL